MQVTKTEACFSLWDLSAFFTRYSLLAVATAQRNTSDAWAKAASELTLSGMSNMAVLMGRAGLETAKRAVDREWAWIQLVTD